MKNKFSLTAIFILITIFASAQKVSGDTLKPYWFYVPLVTFDENCYANGDNWTPNGNYTLPCELIDFNVYCDGKHTIFQWGTMSETNASHFNLVIIYPDGREDKSEYISASGNSNTPRYYKVENEIQYPKGCVIKLTQTDYDGKTHLMATRTIDMTLNSNNITDFSILKDQNSISAVWKSDARLNTTVNFFSLDGRLLGIWSGQSEIGMNHSSSFSIQNGNTCIIVIETPYERQSLKTVL